MLVVVKGIVEEIDGKCSHSMSEGDYFIVEDYKLSLPKGESLCIWALQSLLTMLPLLLERENLCDDHWTHDEIKMTCPDRKVTFKLDLL